MRVVIACDYAHINGGAAKVALSSALALADAGHDVHVFCAVVPIEPKLLEHPKLKVTCVDLPVFTELSPGAALKAGTWNTEAADAFKRLLREYNAKETVVHFHQIRDALTPSVVRIAKEMGFKTVYTAHDFSIGCPYGNFFDSSTQGVCHRTGMSASCVVARCNETGPIKKAAVLYKHRVQMKRGNVPANYDVVAFVSELSKKVLTPYLGSTTKGLIVSNPIDAAKDEPAAISEDSPFVYIGGLIGVKDPVTAARAAKIADAPIEFIGSGPLADEIKKANPNAKLHGWIESSEVRQILRRSRALIFPSIWMETQGMVAYEALANGVPVICSDVTAACDAVVESGGGTLFKAGDSEDLAQKLREYQDIHEVKRKGGNGYAWFWKDPPTMEKHVQRLAEVYGALLSESAS